MGAVLSAPRLVAVSALVLLLTSALHAHAASFAVGTGGIDGPTCGDRQTPCRSIGRAIANAAAGDAIVVGPGRYGDLDGDGSFNGAGEETLGSNACMIVVPKALTLLATRGPDVTIIDAGGAPLHALCLSADGITLGRAKKGFAITGAGSAFADVFVGSSVDDQTTNAIRVRGNRALGSGFGFLVAGTGNAIIGNEAIATVQAGFYVLGPRMILLGNRASAGHGLGFGTSGPSAGEGAVGVVMRKNVASANGGAGFRVRFGSAQLTANVASANGEDGFNVLAGTDHRLKSNDAIGNRRFGIAIEPGARAVVEGGTLVGNGASSAGQNCGLSNASSASIAASRVFWGAPGGPGGDPADAVCNSGGGSVMVKP